MEQWSGGERERRSVLEPQCYELRRADSRREKLEPSGKRPTQLTKSRPIGERELVSDRMLWLLFYI